MFEMSRCLFPIALLPTFGVELDEKLSVRNLEEKSNSAISTVQVVSLVISSNNLYFYSFVGNNQSSIDINHLKILKQTLISACFERTYIKIGKL